MRDIWQVSCHAPVTRHGPIHRLKLFTLLKIQRPSSLRDMDGTRVAPHCDMKWIICILFAILLFTAVAPEYATVSYAAREAVAPQLAQFSGGDYEVVILWPFFILIGCCYVIVIA
jgi:hypothetical protein